MEAIVAEDFRNEPITHAQMDYREHEKTYDLFLKLVKYGTIATIAILLGMLAGLIAGWGIFSSLFVFIASIVILSYILR